MKDTIRSYEFVNGVSQVLISVIYPVLALFLIYEVRKSAKFAAASLSKKSLDDRNRVGRMILVMTVFYVIASAPGGASDFIELFVIVNSLSVLEILVAYGSIMTSALFCLNATSHSIINFTMSSKYRATVKSVLEYGKKDVRVVTV
ncbi:hypothetical protein GCK72_019932 [Caenorhabditis remanei]|uniref:G-protein coupled receptors family 1 profile domain-containing protein n=1 Tax=Caenorhabditis remanei TaxID=31234 RepID=A0A6A5GFA5_CAERE|nr:hypothetical protein GCK72_019932 [Caenorhabditis remanei]KAF1753375.1 hypothetical protein GCK72_019932 [Caenorhabditis remanei]